MHFVEHRQATMTTTKVRDMLKSIYDCIVKIYIILLSNQHIAKAEKYFKHYTF